MADIVEHHQVDEQGRPAGGTTAGVGFSISWQNGPLREPGPDGRELGRNGAFVEDVIAAAIGRIDHYQASQFACEENEQALQYLQLALAELNARTARRVDRGVEGTHVV